MSSAKRLFLYGVAIINLGIFAGGAGTLLRLVFDIVFRSDNWRDYSQMQLSAGLAMLIIGGSLWFFFRYLIRRATAGNPLETGSVIRKLSLNLILTVSALNGLSSLATLIRSVFSWDSLGGALSSALATLVVTACLWLYHSRIENREGQPSPAARTLRRWYLYILAGFGLVMLAVNSVTLINDSFLALPIWGSYTIESGNWSVIAGSPLSRMVVGGFAWWYFWFKLANNDAASTLRQVYLYLPAVTGSVVTGLVAVSLTLYRILGFAFQHPAEADFRFLCWTIPTVLTAAGIWIYHRKTIDEEAGRQTPDRHSPRRVYYYLMSFIGLGTMLTGIVYLFGLLLGLVIDSVSSRMVFDAGWWTGQLSLTLALLLTGAPVWIYFWRKVVSSTSEGGVSERSTTSRRVFLYSVLGIGIIAAVTSLIIIIGQIVNGILQGTFESGTLQSIIWGLAVLFSAIPTLFYHWKLLREDQNLGAEKSIRRKHVVILAGESAGRLTGQIEQKLGYRTRKLWLTGEAPEVLPDWSEEQLEALISQISEAEGSDVFLDLTGETPRLLPYRED
jgi:hypothetical protein